MLINKIFSGLGRLRSILFLLSAMNLLIVVPAQSANYEEESKVVTTKKVITKKKKYIDYGSDSCGCFLQKAIASSVLTMGIWAVVLFLRRNLNQICEITYVDDASFIGSDEICGLKYYGALSEPAIEIINEFRSLSSLSGHNVDNPKHYYELYKNKVSNLSKAEERIYVNSVLRSLYNEGSAKWEKRKALDEQYNKKLEELEKLVNSYIKKMDMANTWFEVNNEAFYPKFHSIEKDLCWIRGVSFVQEASRLMNRFTDSFDKNADRLEKIRLGKEEKPRSGRKEKRPDEKKESEKAGGYFDWRTLSPEDQELYRKQKEEEIRLETEKEEKEKLDKIPSCYAALGLSRGASLNDINRAFRKLVLHCHPDKDRDGSEEVKCLNQEKFKKLSEARDILCQHLECE